MCPKVTGFSRDDHFQLKRILGPAYDKVIGDLSVVVAEARADPEQFRRLASARRESALEHAKKAKRLARTAATLLGELRLANQFVREAVDRRYLTPTQSQSSTTLLAWRELVQPVARLVIDAERWSRAAARDAKRNPGPATEDRVFLAQEVGAALIDAGIRLSRGADGIWARVTTVSYAAAGYAVPQEIDRHLTKAYREMKRLWPDTFATAPIRTASSSR
jgi:hypothetical protein